jgi:GNAT superfamily N-acetyltransferase
MLCNNRISHPLFSFHELTTGLADLADCEKRNAIHRYSNTVLPRFQNQGLGTILKAHWMGLAADKGFEVVYGFARSGASQALNIRFGAVFLSSFPNWDGSGEKEEGIRFFLNLFHGIGL